MPHLIPNRIESDVNVNPTMITLARESRGYTQSALAAAIGVTQGTLSKAENGQIVPSPDLIRRLADRLDYPESLFFETVNFRGLPVSFYRKKARIASGVIRRIQATLNLARMQIGKLLRSVDLPDLRLPQTEVTDLYQAERVARDVRLHWSLPRGPIPDLVGSIEDAGVLVLKSDFGTDRVDAVSIYAPEDGLPPMIFVSATSPGDRLRYSVAHELGHIILHHHLPFSNRDIENEANRFASELLMPAADVGPQLVNLTMAKLASLKAYWKVAMQALLRRAEQLGKINERKRRYLWVQIGRLGYRTREPVQIPAEEPGLVKEIVQFHLDQLDYTERDLSDLIKLRPAEFKTRYVAGTPTLRVVKRPTLDTRPAS